MYNELPSVETSTPAERLQALRDARDLVAGESPKGGFFQTLAGDNGKSGAGTEGKAVTALIRVAEYITTGHDYRDTHPTGEAFTEALTLRKFANKEHRKDHEAHAGHPHMEVHEIPIPRHVAEKILSGEFDPREVINLLREWHEQPAEDDRGE